MEYPNLYTRQKIEALEKDAMRLEDDSVWRIVKDASLPSQETLSVGDEVDIESMGATRPGEEVKSYKVVKDAKKQGFKVSWVNSSDTNIKKLTSCDMTKKRKGTISDGYPLGTELGEAYPDEWLKKYCKIKEIILEERVKNWKSAFKELRNDCMVISDRSPNGSIWEVSHMSKNSFAGWKEGQIVRVFKRESKVTTYWMENLNLPDNQPVSISFKGWAESKF